jgi:hypothetical protein
MRTAYFAVFPALRLFPTSRTFLAAIALTLPGAAPTAAAFGPTASQLPRIADARLDSALARTYRGMIKHNIDPYADGLVHRPNSEEPGDAVSEAESYGMILALYSNDQATFNRIWDAAETRMWNADGKLYDWRVGAKGGIIGSGMATDADQDIALMLLFADSLARKGVWQPHTSPKGAGYKDRALDIIHTIWGSAVVDGRYLAPGAGWGGKDFVNPGYFSPASYRIFAKVDPDHNWKGVIDQCYQTLFAGPGAARGLVPDWMKPTGEYFGGDLGYNAFRGGQSCYKDGIRVQWRLALDWLWFGEPRAKRWLDSAAAFIKTPDRSNFYTMDGVALPATDTFSLGDGQKRSRREYSELTVGMWSCAAFSSLGPEAAKPWADALLAFLPAGADSWGLPADADIPDRTGSMPNEQYFEQFLAWFGGAVLAGRFSNIWDDLDDPNPALALDWKTPPTAAPEVLDFQAGPLHIAGGLNKRGPWKVTIKHYASGAEWSYAERSETVSLDWNGMDAAGKPFPQGWCSVAASLPGRPDEVRWVWLSHHRDLRVDGDWLLIDDFSGPSLSANLGAWGSFDNARAGGTAKVGPLAPSGSGDERALTWDFDLGTGGYQYCGLEWNAAGWPGLAFADRIRYRAKAAQKTVVDFHLVQSDIGDDNYYGALDTLGTAWKVYEHSLKDFRGRLGDRGGSPDPAKGTAFRWHVQFDKNPNAATGTISLDDVRIGGDLAKMYASPDPAVPRTGNPPMGLAPQPERRARRPWVRRGGRWEVHAAPFAAVRWLAVDGRVLGRSRSDADGVSAWTPPAAHAGMVIAESEGRILAALPPLLR